MNQASDSNLDKCGGVTGVMDGAKALAPGRVQVVRRTQRRRLADNDVHDKNRTLRDGKEFMAELRKCFHAENSIFLFCSGC